MLTVDFDVLGLRAGDRAIDIGAGAGRHAFEMYRRGARVTAFDQNQSDMDEVATMFAAMEEVGEAPQGAQADVRVGDALHLPYEDQAFDVVLISEVLEHVPGDVRAIEEVFRVLKTGGRAAVTVPAPLPERLCWALSEEYHTNEGGHIRIYTPGELRDKLVAAGFQVTAESRAHALHSPYWWLKCAVGVRKEDHPLVQAYHKLLVWDMMKRPAATAVAEKVLNPVIGKSMVFYLTKPPQAATVRGGQDADR